MINNSLKKYNLKRNEEKEKYINRVISHNRIVVDLMILLELNRDKLNFDIKEWELIQRGIQHDFDKFDTKFADVVVGIYADEITDNLEEIEKRHKSCHDHHLMNPHHISYHKVNNTSPTDLDICEMCCDAIACLQKPKYSQWNKFKTYREAFEEYVKLSEDKDFFEKYRDKFLVVYELFDELNKKKK